MVRDSVIETVLVLRLSAVGDVVLTSPALEALRSAWPEARILFATHERLQHLVAHNPHLDEVIALRPGESAWSFARRLRALHPTAVLDLHDSLRTRTLRALLPGVRKVVFEKRELLAALLTGLFLRPVRRSVPAADRHHAAVERLVGKKLPRGRLQYFPGPGDVSVADAALRAAGLDPSLPLLGLSPGARWATKRWPAERFAGLARRALEKGMQVAVQGSAGEAALCAQVARDAPGAADLAGKLDLRGLGGFLSRCTAFAGNDSGPMHLARALGVPTLALFGSTDPGLFEFGGHQALFAGVPCSPCSFYGRARCPRGHFRCMLELDEERAWSALLPLFTSRRLPLLSA